VKSEEQLVSRERSLYPFPPLTRIARTSKISDSAYCASSIADTGATASTSAVGDAPTNTMNPIINANEEEDSSPRNRQTLGTWQP